MYIPMLGVTAGGGARAPVPPAESAPAIKELCDTKQLACDMEKAGIRVLFHSITELSNLIRELSNLFQDELNSRAL